MTKIFRVGYSPSDISINYSDDNAPAVVELFPYATYGQSVVEFWPDTEMIFSKGADRAADFWGGALFLTGVSKRAVDAFRSVLERDGEIVPVSIDGTDAFIFNVTNRIDCLDEDLSERLDLGNGMYGALSKPVFRLGEFERSGFFRIGGRRSNGNRLYYVDLEGSSDGTKEDFRTQYLESDFKGLTFELIQSD